MSPDLGDLFLDQVRARPDATAISFRGGSISYRALHERAAAVAAGLVELGVRRETLVGMSFERSADAVVAMLGIVLAGGAYVPLNPSFPAERLRALVADSAVAIVLCDKAGAGAVRSAVPHGVDARTLDAVAVPGAPAPERRSDPTSLAYVMYTSGSTGSPKGVLVEHRGIARLARDPDYLDISPDDTFLHLSALEFDASTWEIWGALLNGAAVCVVDRETALVPWKLGEALREHHVTVAWLTSALFNQLVDEDPAIFGPLRALLTGGDVVSPRHAAALLAHHPHLALYNGYGPTENTTFTTVHRITPGTDGPIPIGRPIRGTTILVLDADGEAADEGELYAGGEGVARGYLNNDDLTRERFVDVRGERYYRTGDLVRLDADGMVHFRGRTDNQVKIRGNRVELGEVTVALLAVPEVTDAYVRVVGDAEDKRMVAHVVAAGLTDAAVRAAVAARVPGYLVPDQIVLIDRLPLNANGKVDASVLAAPVRGLARQTPRERELARLWGAVLGMDPACVPAEASFFDVGGNSIKLGVLLGRIARQRGVQLTFQDAFAAPTLAAMAEALAVAPRAVAEPIPGVPTGDPVALHPRQVALHALWQVDPASPVYNIPVRVAIGGDLDVPRLRAAFTTLVDRHDALRMRFTYAEGAVRQAAAAVTATLDYRAEPEPDVLSDFVRPFDLGAPPLVRGLLMRTGPHAHELYLDAHHVVVDGVSLRVLVSDLFDLYAGADLPPPVTTYASAARWAARREPSAADEEFWLAELAGVPAGLNLPTDRPRGATRAVRGAVARRVLDGATAAALDEAARELGVTPAAVVLAAYTAALARLSGERDLVVGSPMNGRTHPDVESVVGMFVSTVCLRARVDTETTVADLARQVGGRQVAALTHQDYPFERLVERLGVPRDPARNPLFDALFAYQDIEFYEFAKAGLTLSLELLNPGTTRFDLNLQAYRRPDRLVLDLEHAADLFDRASADYLLDQCARALDELTTAPDTPVFAPVSGATAVSAADFSF